MADPLEKEPLKSSTNDDNSTANNCSPDVAVCNSLDGALSQSPDGDTCQSPDDATLDPPMAPDGGYGWVILCASFFVNFLVDGVCFSFGIFFLEFLEHFGESKETTSWVGSVLNGMYLFLGKLLHLTQHSLCCSIFSLLAKSSLSSMYYNVYFCVS
jgi:hypothetical protein